MTNVVPLRTSEPRYIDILSYKGGVGVSTIAVVLAAQLAKRGLKVTVVDTSPLGDLAAIFGTQTPAPGTSLEVGRHLHLRHLPCGTWHVPDGEYDVVITDWGNRHYHPSGRGQDIPSGGERTRVCVLRNDYMCLRNAVQMNAGSFIDRIVLVEEPNRVLNERDVASVMRVDWLADIVTVPIDPSVSRASDAGLLAMRADLINLETLMTWMAVGE